MWSFVIWHALTAALALGDPYVKIEDVTPKIFPSGPLFPTEVSTQLNLRARFIPSTCS